MKRAFEGISGNGNFQVAPSLRLYNKKMKKVKSAIDIIRLPKQEWDTILRTAGLEAEKEYVENSSLIFFDAFAEGDLYDETK